MTKYKNCHPECQIECKRGQRRGTLLRTFRSKPLEPHPSPPQRLLPAQWPVMEQQRGECVGEGCSRDQGTCRRQWGCRRGMLESGDIVSETEKRRAQKDSGLGEESRTPVKERNRRGWSLGDTK